MLTPHIRSGGRKENTKPVHAHIAHDLSLAAIRFRDLPFMETNDHPGSIFLGAHLCHENNKHDYIVDCCLLAPSVATVSDFFCSKMRK